MITEWGSLSWEAVDSEKDLGVIDKHLNISLQCDVVDKRTNTILGCINRIIASRSRKILFNLCLMML